MGTSAFFFQKDSLVLPTGKLISPAELEMPLDLEIPPFSDTFTVTSLDGTEPISCVFLTPEASLPSNLQTITVRQMLTLLSDSVWDDTSPVARMLRAYHLAHWRSESRFCGSCGGKNVDSDEPARRCPVCGRMEFPRITPAVITLIVNDEGKALLAHNKKFTTGIYSLIAGFAEAGESLEAAVARETREEVGIAIRDIRYIVSQPWPFPNALMLGFCARHASGTIRADGAEIIDARWFDKDELPMLPGPGSVARRLIDRWLDGTLQA